MFSSAPLLLFGLLLLECFVMFECGIRLAGSFGIETAEAGLVLSSKRRAQRSWHLNQKNE